MKHNFPKNITIVCNEKHNLAQAKEILKLAIDADINIDQATLEVKVDSDYPYFMVDKSLDLTQNMGKESDAIDDLVVNYEEFKAFFIGKGKYKPVFKEEIKLNSSYTAEITKANIIVGCQTFSHEILKKLYLSSQKAQKS